jgi:thiamine transporter ThiT
MARQKNSNIKNVTSAAICLALCMVLPFLTGQIPQIGSMLSPMHIPVILCGFIAGPWWALFVGLIAPLLRFALFSMPPIMPVGLAMTFELGTYGLVSGLLYRYLPRRKSNIYVSLIGAMLVGRIIWGIAMYMILTSQSGSFTFAAFIAGAFTNAVPGIALHIILIPLIVFALEKAGLTQPSRLGRTTY